jgi:hypothetical protein
VSSNQTNNLDGCENTKLTVKNRKRKPYKKNVKKNAFKEPTSHCHRLLLYCYSTIPDCSALLCYVGCGCLSQIIAYYSYTKALSRSAESLSQTFKSFPSATDSCVLLAELHYNIVACFILRLSVQLNKYAAMFKRISFHIVLSNMFTTFHIPF